MSPIGYYVHHHGEGHRRRAMAIAAAAPGRFTLIGTGVADLYGPFETLDLPDDRLTAEDAFFGHDGSGARPDALHYAPYDHEGVRARMSAIASWIAEQRPALMVIDVSVEIAMLSRLCATPTVVVRLAGARNDPAHLDAFRGARALLAPYDERLEDDLSPDWVRRKTTHVAGIGCAAALGDACDDVVVAVFGRGGTNATVDDLVAAATASPESHWRILGPFARPQAAPRNLDVLGWVAEPEREIAQAGIVVGGAGDGVLGSVAAAAKPFICIPEDRPFGEQSYKAARLRSLSAAVVRSAWPSAAEWPSALDRARALDTAVIGGLHDPNGSAVAMATIMEAMQ